MIDLYYYGYLYRPPMPGAQPKKGLVDAREKDFEVGGKHLGGYAVYNRPLTWAEMRQYELIIIERDDI